MSISKSNRAQYHAQHSKESRSKKTIPSSFSYRLHSDYVVLLLVLLGVACDALDSHVVRLCGARRENDLLGVCVDEPEIRTTARAHT